VVLLADRGWLDMQGIKVNGWNNGLPLSLRDWVGQAAYLKELVFLNLVVVGWYTGLRISLRLRKWWLLAPL
jgi:hypothetical protein